ncbi:MAG: DNA recombination protein RmuC [Acidobacteria bacterium]|nr:DNA recombination protein RmuC [Acidobacteriota bacterium]
MLDDAQSKLSDAFKALASGVMEQSNKQFLELAKTSFETLQTKASGDLTQRQQAIESLVAPLGISLNSMLQEVGRLEESRQKAYGELTTQVGQLAKSSEDLREETGTLVTSLRQPQIKGKWGEITLRRAVELAGMSPHCTFVEQASLDSDEGRLRPDLTVQITGNRRIIVDAKVPLHAYMKGASAQTAEEYRDAMAAHAQLVRNHVSELSRRDYSSYLERSIGHAVCYLPAESFFSAALEQDHSLIEYAKDKNVLLASPTILIALLCAIATGWKEEQVAENAARISENARELYERFTTFAQHLEDIYAGLERANKAFNAAVGSYEQRLLPGARKFKDLGIQSTAEAPELEPTQTSLRAFTATSSDKP